MLSVLPKIDPLGKNYPLMAAVVGFVVAVPATYSYILWKAEQRAAQP